MTKTDADAELLAKINAAVKAANEAEKIAETAKAELVSKSKAVGVLLLEAKKVHPAVEDFKAFLKRVNGLQLSRAYDCMAIAGGRTTDDELREETRKRVKKHRAKKKSLPRPPAPKAEPKPISVTLPDVTESAEISIEKRKAQHEALDSEEPLAKASTEAQHSDTNKDVLDDPLVIIHGDWIDATPWFSSKIKPIFEGLAKNDAAKSATALAEFKRACATFLPQMTTKDLEAALDIYQVISDLKYGVESAKAEAKLAAAAAKRVKWETSHPEEAKNKAREQAQRYAMEDEIADAKAEAREGGELWSDIKDDWIDEWIADNWGAEEEAEFEKDFQEQWARDHGVTHKEAA